MSIMSATEVRANAITSVLDLSDDVLQQVAARLLDQFNKGLGKETHDTAEVKMFITYVRDVPDGTEEGRFIALDLGGTNFRVISINIEGGKFVMDSKVFAVPQAIMVGTGTQLFDHIAECVQVFLKNHKLAGEKLPLGFTFSFPCVQEGLSAARLARWSKGFTCSGVIDHDVVQLLNDALKRRDLNNINVVAVVNDTTGTLLACALKNNDCRVGLIIGTGTNACYMERLENVDLWTGDREEPTQVIINTEWGAFGDQGTLEFVRTRYDKEVDLASVNPGKQIFEKMISGMYMGELVRRAVLHLAEEGVIFSGRLSEKMKTIYAFRTKYVSQVESEPEGTYVQARDVLAKMDQLGSDDDCRLLRMVCTRVSTRSAGLTSAAVSTILNKIKRPYTAVGVDGSVYRFHPHFHNRMMAKLGNLVNPEYKFGLMLTEDGSGCGAAIAAAVAARGHSVRTEQK